MFVEGVRCCSFGISLAIAVPLDSPSLCGRPGSRYGETVRVLATLGFGLLPSHYLYVC